MDETKGHVMFRLGVAMCVLSTLSIVLRFWARLARENISVGWDDWLAVCAWVCQALRTPPLLFLDISDSTRLVVHAIVLL